MHPYEKFDTISEYKNNLAGYSTWEKSKNFKSIGSTVYFNGKDYTLLDKKERVSKTFGKIALGVLAVFFSLGLSLISKNVRNLFTGREVKHFALEKSMVEHYNDERLASTNKVQNTLNLLTSSLIIKDASLIDISDTEISTLAASIDKTPDASTTTETAQDTENPIRRDLNNEEPVVDLPPIESVSEDTIKQITQAEKEANVKAKIKEATEPVSLQACEFLRGNIFAVNHIGKNIFDMINLVGNFSLESRHALTCTSKDLQGYYEERSKVLVGKIELIIQQGLFFKGCDINSVSKKLLYCKNLGLSSRIKNVIH